ncbi:MAG: hypothetical protein SGCHY_003529, partial [Lobulomycetales sp.]
RVSYGSASMDLPSPFSVTRAQETEAKSRSLDTPSIVHLITGCFCTTYCRNI